MKTEERLYFETDSSCSYCGLKDNRAFTIHHINQSEPKDNSYENIILLCHNCHQCHHQSKGPTPGELKEIKRRLILKTITQIGLNALKEAHRNQFVVAIPFLLNHLVELGYLQMKDVIIRTGDTDIPGSEAISLATYFLTDKGRQIISIWNLI